jgi:tRNA(Arg) A34 adenosine deaminase TadA
MRLVSIQNGDQPYGAVVARRGVAVGHGPSRVRELGEGAGHAERVAIRMAQARLGKADLSGCELYSTSPPCRACESAAAEAKIARMYYGRDPTDAGVPRP